MQMTLSYFGGLLQRTMIIANTDDTIECTSKGPADSVTIHLNTDHLQGAALVLPPEHARDLLDQLHAILYPGGDE